MIYLDYSAATPIDNQILDLYVKVSKEYIGNVNSKHALGVKSRKLFDDASMNIAREFNCYSKEIIFTSGASESNTMAILGVAKTFSSIGKHIITSKLEHKSILDLMNNLSKKGYIIDYVNLLPNGQIDLLDLENKIRKDTILISICGVNSEVGYFQPLKNIRQIINKKNSRIVFHSDLTQALGKTKIDLRDVDLATFSSNKIYGPHGCGILYKRRTLSIGKLIYGTTFNSPFRGGTPALPLIVAFSKAIELANKNLDENIEKCKFLNKMLINGLTKYPIKINSNELCVPQIVNISLLNISNDEFVKELSDYKIYVSTTSACCTSDRGSIVLNEINNNDQRISQTSIRISISHLTTEKEITTFLSYFNIIWNRLNK